MSISNLTENLFDPSISTIAEKFSGQPAVQARLLLAIGRGLAAVGRHQDGVAILQRILALPKKPLAEHWKTTLRARMCLAVSFAALGRSDEAAKFAEEALRLCRQREVDELLMSRALIARGTSFMMSLRHADAEPYYVKATGLLAGRTDEDSRNLYLRAEAALQIIMSELGRFDEAESRARATLALLESQSAPQAMDIVLTRLSLGIAIMRGGRARDAIEELEHALTYARAAIGDDATMTLTVLQNLADALGAEGRFAEAETLLAEGRATASRVFGETSQVARRLDGMYGTFLFRQGRYAEAERVADRVLEVVRAGEVNAHLPELLSALIQRANALSATGQAGGGRGCVPGAHWEISERSSEKIDRSRVRILHGLGAVLRERDKLEPAEVILRSAFAAAREYYGDRHGETIAIRMSLAVMLEAAGKNRDAATMFAEVVDARRDLFGADHPSTYTATINLATSLDDADRAIALLVKAFSGLKRKLGPTHPYVVAAGARLGILYLREKPLGRSRAVAPGGACAQSPGLWQSPHGDRSADMGSGEVRFASIWKKDAS